MIDFYCFKNDDDRMLFRFSRPPEPDEERGRVYWIDPPTLACSEYKVTVPNRGADATTTDGMYREAGRFVTLDEAMAYVASKLGLLVAPEGLVGTKGLST